MPHFFIKSDDKINDKIHITDKENYNHIVKSLRSKVGETVLFIDENEIEYKTVVEDIQSNYLVANIVSEEKSMRKLPYNLYLAQSPLKSDAQLTVVEKATELGVKGIYPIYTDNCALKKTVAEQKIMKWQKVMCEASKQCERANVPTCFELSNLEDVLNTNPYHRIIAFCERNTNMDLKTYLSDNPIKKGENILVIIGPEGGFSKREFEMFQRENLPMVSLGNLILKAETAVIISLGNIIYEYGNRLKTT